MAKKFNFKIVNKEFQFSSQTHLALWHEFLKQCEGKVVQVSKYIPVRTDQQNKYYWLYLGMIESETGNNSVTMHEYFKRVFLPPKFIKYKDKEIKIPASTTELTKIEMGEYLDKICAETGVALPNPMELEGYIPN